MAEKIFLADKPTLGYPNPTVPGTDSVMNYLKKLDDAIAPKALLTFTDKKQSTVAGTWYEVLNITGRGSLKHCITTSIADTHSGLFDVVLQVTIDDVVVYTTKSSAYRPGGIVNPAYMNTKSLDDLGKYKRMAQPLLFDGEGLCFGLNPSSYDYGSLTNPVQLPNINENKATYVLTEKGIPFNKNLIIRVKSKNNASNENVAPQTLTILELI